jgi:hypothetical protein
MESYNKDVPYIVYESEAARHERTVKRLLTALLITILLMVGTNLAWLYVWNQYDFSTEEITIDTQDEGSTAYMGAGASGVINNGIENTGEAQDDNEA